MSWSRQWGAPAVVAGGGGGSEPAADQMFMFIENFVPSEEVVLHFEYSLFIIENAVEI